MSYVENKINILAKKDMSDDLKLYEIFQEYKVSLKSKYPDLYYALLGWQDNHIHEILEEQSKIFHKNLNEKKKGN